MNELAIKLNETLGSAAEFLSPAGKRMYFPYGGILGQGAEAKTCGINATIGMAFEEDGSPLVMDCFKKSLGLDKKAFLYAGSFGLPKLRELWREMEFKKNPSLKGKTFSNPVVTNALTHGIRICAELFAGADDTLVTPDLFWDNYELVCQEAVGCKVAHFNTFKKGAFDTEAMKKALLAEGEKKILILNFPNNPTGYTPSKEEALAIVEAVKEVAESGKKILVISDDAYFGLFYEEETEKESLFSRFADAHENILAIKGDAATKEEMVWGFRIGFITYAGKGLGPKELDALEKKTLGAVRCTVSNCDRPGQSLLKKGMKGSSYNKDKDHLFDTVGERYRVIKKTLEAYKDSTLLQPYPFNSGYFMAFDTMGRNAEELRLHLLSAYEVGAINIMGRTLRLAYCSVEKENLEDLVRIVYKAAEEIWS